MAIGHRGSVRKRTLVLFVLILLVYVALAGRLAYVQVLKKPELEGWSKKIRFRKNTLYATRGCIYDRDKRVLALSIDAVSVYACRRELRNIPQTAARLAQMLHADRAAIERKLQNGTSSTIWLAKKVHPLIGYEISRGYRTTVRRKIKGGYKDVVVRERLPGIGVQRDSKRVYPACTMAAQVLGFVSADKRYNEGLERVQDELLTGADGLETTELDARRRDIPQSLRVVSRPVNGKDIVLTIDSTVQQIAEEALGKMAQTYHPRSACAIVLDPKTGEVLALANYPFFDPNSTTRTDPGLWRNRAVADLYEPGSTLKVVTVAAALNEGIGPHEIVTRCSRREKIKGGRITCTVHYPFTNGHGPVDMYKIIQYSCNIGAAHLAMRMGAEKLYGYEKAFGLLDRPDAGFGGEAVGYMLPAEDWRLIKLANVGFGQGINVSALQMAAVYGAIANGGVYVEPKVVREVWNSDGTVIQRFRHGTSRRVVSSEAAAELTKMLMVCAEEGTGKPAQIPGRTVAGKTGSAQISKPKGGYESGAFVASFMGFAPARNPRLVIAVVVNRPQGSHWGATVAAPVFREIGENALANMRVPLDAPLTPKPSPKPTAKPGNSKGLV